MRLLHLYTGTRSVPHLMIDFVLGLSKYCEIFIYGPDEHESRGDKVAPIKYDEGKPLKEVVDIIRPDILVLPEYMLLTKDIKGYEEIKNINYIPKVSIEVDAYVFENLPQWHISMGIDFVISKGPWRKSHFSVPSVWLPFSVPDSFYLKEFTTDRFNKILFFGGGRFDFNELYKVRKKAIFLLERNDMLDYFPSNTFSMYRDYLRKYKCGLSCSFSRLKMSPAKNFEIAGSGCLLFTNDFVGRELLFGDKLFIEYNPDCSDIIAKAEDILTHDYSDLAYAAWKVVGERHLDSIRILELYNILNSIMKNEKVEDRWNIG